MPKSPPADAFSLQPGVQAAWRDYLDALEPLRHELFRYCLGLTGDVWDAEDLVQDALLRVFGHLGKINAPLREPRAYLCAPPPACGSIACAAPTSSGPMRRAARRTSPRRTTIRPKL